MAADKNAMALYVKVVENKSFSKTAQREGVPLSTVSRKLSDLEKELGVRLLERSTRQLRMTEIGQEYYERCRRGLEEFEAANLLATDRQADVSGRLRISVPPSLSGNIVMPLIEAFRLVHPKVMIHCLVTDRHVDHIADGIDLSVRVGALKDSSLVARSLLRYRSVLVASPGYLKGIDGPAHPSELAEHCLVAFSRWDTTVSWTLERGDDMQKITIEPRIATNDYVGVQKAVTDGQGISEIPSIVCGEDLKNGRLVEVMPNWQFVPVTIAAIYPSNRNLSRVVRLFRDFLVEQFENFAPHA